MMVNFVGGGVVILVLVCDIGFSFEVVDVGMLVMEVMFGIVIDKLCYGMCDFSVEVVFMLGELVFVFEVGGCVVVCVVVNQFDFLIFGEMGIGNIMILVVIVVSLFGISVGEVVGSGIGVDVEGCVCKVCVIDVLIVCYGVVGVRFE